nr:hypothetical protein HCAJSMRY_HCAJSMRY_CDS_0006 [Microvirus sp.]
MCLCAMIVLSVIMSVGLLSVALLAFLSLGLQIGSEPL